MEAIKIINLNKEYKDVKALKNSRIICSPCRKK